MGVLFGLQTIAAGVVLAVLLYLVIRSPRNIPLRALTVAIMSFSLTVVFGGPATTGMVFLGFEPVLSRLIQHQGLIIGGYALITFYLFSALDSARARRQASRQAVPFAVATVLMVSATAMMPAELRHSAATMAFARPGAGRPDLTIVGLYLTPSLYLAYAFAIALLWTRRYATGAEPRLRLGLALTSIGLTALVLGQSLMALANGAQWLGIAMPLVVYRIALLAILPGSVVFMAGFAYPATRTRLAAARVWLQHRRAYRRLRPLWTMLNQQFPEDTLHRVPTGRWRDLLTLRGVHRRYYRRVIECRDGLVRISPYLDDGTGSLAERLRAGLLARAAGEPAYSRPVPVAIPATDGLDADARELVSLSESLRVRPA